jgi:hypothetical protein
VKLNPFNMACLLHAGFLFGEVQDSNEPLVTTVIEPWGRDTSQEQRDAAARLSDVVNRVWCENAGRALQQEAGLISQILGGCVFGVAYDPRLEAEGKLPIRIDHTLPDYFFPVPEPARYWEANNSSEWPADHAVGPQVDLYNQVWRTVPEGVRLGLGALDPFHGQTGSVMDWWW